MFAATLLASCLGYLSGYGYMRVSAAMLLDMRLKVYAHLHALSPRFFAKARIGDLVSRLNGDVAEVQRRFTSATSGLMRTFCECWAVLQDTQ